MKKTNIAIIFILLLGLAAAYGYRKYTQREPVFEPNQAGKLAPDFDIPSLSGGSIKLSDYKGKLVLLNFFASWCPPCRAEIPSFIKAQDKYKDKPFTFIGLAIEDKKAVERYVKQIGINYPVGYGIETTHATATAYGDPDGALPYSILISKDQKILAVYAGVIYEEKLFKLIEDNL
jgi:thiol-disulfide isomerase/thioredoxin